MRWKCIISKGKEDRRKNTKKRKELEKQKQEKAIQLLPKNKNSQIENANCRILDDKIIILERQCKIRNLQNSESISVFHFFVLQHRIFQTYGR